MNATGTSDLENWYNYLGRIQKRMIKKNLRYLLSVIFQAGVASGEIDEVPPIKVSFNPLWSLSEQEEASLEQMKAATEQTRAQTTQIYVDMQVIDPSEVRKTLGDSEQYDVEEMLDDYSEEELFENMPQQGQEGMPGGEGGGDPMAAMMQGMGGSAQGEPAQAGAVPQTGEEKPVEKPGKDEPTTEEQTSENAPAAAPAATKLPQDMSPEEKERAEEAKKPETEEKVQEEDSEDISTQTGGVGVIVVKDGKILVGSRMNDTDYGKICGPGGHIEAGETPEQAAIRETQEEFGITPLDLVEIGRGPEEAKTGYRSHVFLCTEFEGEPVCQDLEMTRPKFLGLDEIKAQKENLFQPFRDSIPVFIKVLSDAEEAPKTESRHSFGGSGIRSISQLKDFIMNLDRTRNDYGVPGMKWYEHIFGDDNVKKAKEKVNGLQPAKIEYGKFERPEELVDSIIPQESDLEDGGVIDGEALLKYSAMKKAKKNPEKMKVPVNRIYTDQLYVNKKKVLRYIDAFKNRSTDEESEGNPIVLIKNKDKYSLLDGNHRVTAAIYLGIDNVEADVYDVSKEDE